MTLHDEITNSQIRGNLNLQTRKWPVLAVLGPTASGKTSLALHIAGKFDCEVVNCDSRQIYSEMRIGTACPTPEELNFASHHLYNFLSPAETFSAADFAAAAASCIRGIWSRGKTPLLTGGTGFYYAAVSKGLGDAGHDPHRAEQLRNMFEERGLAHMVEMLNRLDPSAAGTVDLNNPRRVLRAIEIVESTGQPFTKNLPQPLLVEAEFLPVVVTRPRAILHAAIEHRVNQMLIDGLESEVRQLIEKYGQSAGGLNSIGYQEWFEYFSGKISVKAVKEQIIINTRQYAKRQETWFRRRPGVEATDLNDQKQCAAIFPQIAAFLGKFAL